MRRLKLAFVAALVLVPSLVPASLVATDEPVTLPDVCLKCSRTTLQCVEVDCATFG
ncbi:MAG TPA: hypothetical protein VHN15_12260 [Thermoanaerobaculia bacterium]|nr:hypothetical protein [Thermoanaerobaculia bacterium]